MDYAAFVKALARDPRNSSLPEPPNLVIDMASYLTQVAHRFLAGLDRNGDETTCRRLAAVSGLVRASPPDATIVLDQPDISTLAMARLDILVPRNIIVAAPDHDEGKARWRNLEMACATEQIASLAERIGVFCPTPVLASGTSPPHTAQALVTHIATPDSIKALSGLRHILWVGGEAGETP
jgi:hypothetical protein